jgi:hypothetical protein
LTPNSTEKGINLQDDVVIVVVVSVVCDEVKREVMCAVREIVVVVDALLALQNSCVVLDRGACMCDALRDDRQSTQSLVSEDPK